MMRSPVRPNAELSGGVAVRLERVKKETPSLFGLKGHDGDADQPSFEEEVSTNTITIGVDLAKSVSVAPNR